MEPHSPSAKNIQVSIDKAAIVWLPIVEKIELFRVDWGVPQNWKSSSNPKFWKILAGKLNILVDHFLEPVPENQNSTPAIEGILNGSVISRITTVSREVKPFWIPHSNLQTIQKWSKGNKINRTVHKQTWVILEFLSTIDLEVWQKVFGETKSHTDQATKLSETPRFQPGNVSSFLYGIPFLGKGFRTVHQFFLRYFSFTYGKIVSKGIFKRLPLGWAILFLLMFFHAGISVSISLFVVWPILHGPAEDNQFLIREAKRNLPLYHCYFEENESPSIDDPLYQQYMNLASKIVINWEKQARFDYDNHSFFIKALTKSMRDFDEFYYDERIKMYGNSPVIRNYIHSPNVWNNLSSRLKNDFADSF